MSPLVPTSTLSPTSALGYTKSMQLIARSVAAVLAALFLTVPGAFAQSLNLSNPDSVGIQVSPVVDDFEIQPGQTVEREMEISGLTQRSVTYFPIVMNFEADKTTGKPVFLSENERFSKYSLSTWVAFPQETITIEPGENEVLRYTVTAPSDATPGGHYGAILLSTEAPKFDEEGILVGVVGLIGTLALATVPGDITEQLIISEFTSPTLLFAPPANFSVTISNLGNVHLRPEGGITIRNWFGKQVKFLQINEGAGAILPESQRQFDNAWQFSWSAIGRYTANLSMNYGSGLSIAELRVFYIIPYWLLIVLAFIIAGIFAGKIIMAKRRKRELLQPPPPRRIVMG